MQNLKHAIVTVHVRVVWVRGATIQSSLRFDNDKALMVTSGIFRSRDVMDLPSLAVVTRMYTAVPVYRDKKSAVERNRKVIPGAGTEDLVYLIDRALKPKVECVH